MEEKEFHFHVSENCDVPNGTKARNICVFVNLDAKY